MLGLADKRKPHRLISQRNYFRSIPASRYLNVTNGGTDGRLVIVIHVQ